MIKYYVMAANTNSFTAIYNLSQYYKSNHNVEEMLKYYNIGKELGDSDCIYELANYYESIRDYEKMVEYYEMAVKLEEMQIHKVNDGIKGFNIIKLVGLLEKMNQTKEIKEKLHILKNKKEYLIYMNKISLFTKLQHIQECAICYETKLHIDIKCGHTFCVDCYPLLLKKPCPLCRL